MSRWPVPSHRHKEELRNKAPSIESTQRTHKQGRELKHRLSKHATKSKVTTCKPAEHHMNRKGQSKHLPLFQSKKHKETEMEIHYMKLQHHHRKWRSPIRCSKRKTLQLQRLKSILTILMFWRILHLLPGYRLGPEHQNSIMSSTARRTRNYNNINSALRFLPTPRSPGWR